MEPIELIAKVRSGVAQIILERGRERISSGSAFLVDEGLVTNSHNIRSFTFDAIVIRFEDTEPSAEIRLLRDDCLKIIAAESPENEKDYLFLKLSEPEFEGRYVFEFTDSSDVSVGEQIVFLGFPFGSRHLTAHSGYVSSLHCTNDAKIIQIDGSVNGGNSGGPLLELKTGRVAGIVTRAETGIITRQFNSLIDALRHNQQALSSQGARMQIGGIDPIEAIKVSQAAMEQIAVNLRRSANVGIGFAFSAKYVKDKIDSLGLGSA